MLTDARRAVPDINRFVYRAATAVSGAGRRFEMLLIYVCDK